GMEQLQYNLLYRWLVGLGVDDPGAACRQSAKTASGELLEPPPLPIRGRHDERWVSPWKIMSIARRDWAVAGHLL
ncbi:MAG: hypothetical protein ACXVG9_12380, partial [Terriglobales bacterium]